MKLEKIRFNEFKNTQDTFNENDNKIEEITTAILKYLRIRAYYSCHYNKNSGYIEIADKKGNNYSISLRYKENFIIIKENMYNNRTYDYVKIA